LGQALQAIRVQVEMPIEVVAPEIYEYGVDNEWKVAAGSARLSGRPSKINIKVGHVEDQGWGGKKGNLGLALYDKEGNFVERENLFGIIRSEDFDANYGTPSPERSILPSEAIIYKAAAGFQYKLEYTVGHGGGHELKVEGWTCNILFDGDEEENPDKAMMRKYIVAMGKVIAGGIRCFFEDILSGGCQMIYLCKGWKHIGLGSKIFTLASIGAGLALSMAGPLYEYTIARRMRKKIMETGVGGKFNDRLADLDNEPEPETEKSPLLQAQQAEDRASSSASDPVPQDVSLEDGTELSNAKTQEQCQQKNKVLGITVVPDLKITDIVRGKRGASTRAGPMLLAGSVWLWVSMLILPFLVPIECGQPAPTSAILIFFATSMSLSLLEIWVTIQSSTGYLAFKHMRAKFILGYMLSHVGRFDTFSDVIFAKMIRECEPITWFSIWDSIFWLPFGWDLASMVLVIFLFGVVLMQAVPGVILLARQGGSYLPVGLKLNEYNLLLTVMDMEAGLTEPLSEEEQRSTESAVRRAAHRIGLDAAGASTAAGVLMADAGARASTVVGASTVADSQYSSRSEYSTVAGVGAADAGVLMADGSAARPSHKRWRPLGGERRGFWPVFIKKRISLPAGASTAGLDAAGASTFATGVADAGVSMAEATTVV